VSKASAPGGRRRALEVADEIERMIRSGEYRAGERLPSEAELSKRLSVGRPSVREALFMLQFRGLVETTNGARATVTAPGADFFLRQMSDVAINLARLPDGQKHLEEVRLVFESGVAWLAAQTATPDDIARLEAALAANAAAAGDREQLVRSDVAFHYEIVRIVRNPVFNAFHDVLVEWLIGQRTTTISLPDADRLSLRDHTAICAAVASRDPARAYHEMASHLRLISRLYDEAMRLRETLLRQVTQDVAAQMRAENAEIWKASFGGRDGDEPGKAGATDPAGRDGDE
jgi:GntR family transcriptional repressor for pyruvate dehydrogenase complex